MKREPTLALQQGVNGKLLNHKKTETIVIQLYCSLRYRVPKSA